MLGEMIVNIHIISPCEERRGKGSMKERVMSKAEVIFMGAYFYIGRAVSGRWWCNGIMHASKMAHMIWPPSSDPTMASGAEGGCVGVYVPVRV